MGRTKDLRHNIPFSPKTWGSMEEFAAAIGWDLSPNTSEFVHKSWDHYNELLSNGSLFDWLHHHNGSEINLVNQ
jgi:hypothetical protein